MKVQTLTGKVVATYTYDENGLRLTKTVGDTTHEYFYNDEVLNMEVVKTNGKTQYRYYEWNGYTPLGMIVKEDGEEKAYQYDAFGNILSIEGEIAESNPIRYAGYYYDGETKNYYLQARYYNPANGSFLALDPHPGDDNTPLSQNGYTYADNNPVMNIDPNGKWAFLWWMAKGALLGGLMAYVKYITEVRLGLIKRNTSNAIAKVAMGALSGAVLGGIGVSSKGLNYISGLLKLAMKRKYLSRNEIRIANYIIYGQYSVLKSIVNHFNTTPGKQSWRTLLYKQSRRFF